MDASYPIDALPIGTKLDHDRYEVQSILGRGTFGITYLAKDHLGRQVAIKEFFPTGYVTRDDSSTVTSSTGEKDNIFDNGLKKFLGEAKTIARFKHPNLVYILAYFEQNGTGYITMDYEPGEDLRAYLHDHEVSEHYLITLFTLICNGLGALHQKGYIHRDIKTANIRIRDDGSPVLLDFGAARDIFTSRPDQLTRIFTQSYAPYEQINPGWAEQGPWTDIYALAVTLYYAVSKEMPADAQARASALMNEKPDPYEPLVSNDQHGFSAEFLAAINNAMNFEPDRRPASALGWAQQLTTADTQGQQSSPSANSRTAENTNYTPTSTAVKEETSTVDSRTKTWINKPISPRKAERTKFPRLKKIVFTLAIAMAATGGGWYMLQNFAPEPTVTEPGRNPTGNEFHPSFLLTTHRGDRPQYHQGEKIEILVSSNENLFIYCFYQEENADLFRIFPNADQPDAYINKDVTITIPSASNSLEAGEAGQDLFQCFGLSSDITKPLANQLGDNDGMEPIAAMTLAEIKDFITTQFTESPVAVAKIPIRIE